MCNCPSVSPAFFVLVCAKQDQRLERTQDATERKLGPYLFLFDVENNENVAVVDELCKIRRLRIQQPPPHVGECI